MNTPEESAAASENSLSQLVAPQSSVARPVTPQEFHPDNPPWGTWQALLTWLLSMILLVVVPLICSLPYLVYRYPGMNVSAETLMADKTFIFLNVLSYIPMHVLTLILGWLVVTQMGRFNFWRIVGWNWPPKLGFWKSAGLAFLLFGLALVLTSLFRGGQTDIERIVQSSRQTAYVLAFLAVATAPLAEEVIYRGILYPALQRSIGVAGAVILVACLFAGGHVYQYRHNLGVVYAIVLLSVALTVLRARTGRLLPCFIVHLVFNGIQSVGIVLAPYLRGLDPGQEPKAAAILIFFRWFHHLL